MALPFRGILVMLLASVSTFPGYAGSWGGPLNDAVHRQLDRTVTPQANNEHLPRLASLRALKDPRLLPLFASLAERSEPSIQVHAVLGLAELSGDGQLDIEQVIRTHPDARRTLIDYGVSNDLLSADDLHTLRQVTALTPGEHLMAMAGLIQVGSKVDVADVRQINTAEDLTAAGLQAVLLASLDDPSALQSWSVLEQDDAEARRFELLEMIRQLPSDGGHKFAVDAASTSEADGVRRFALLVLLEADHPEVMQLVEAESARADRHRAKVDLAMLLMMTATSPPETLRHEANDSPLLLAMLEMAEALSTDEENRIGLATDALIEMGHRRSISWLVDAASDWPTARAVGPLERMLDQARDAEFAGEFGAHAVNAATALLEQSPDTFRTRLSRVTDDSPEQQILLLAMLQQPTPDLIDTVRSIRRIGLGAADTLALLVTARDSPTLTDSDVARLKRVAARLAVSSDLRTQAAWLAVRHDGSVDDMVASLINPAQ